jgi:hypothetical protein
MRVVVIVAVALGITPALAQTLYCWNWQGVRTCQGPGGCTSTETRWESMTTGSGQSARSGLE